MFIAKDETAEELFEDSVFLVSPVIALIFQVCFVVD